MIKKKTLSLIIGITIILSCGGLFLLFNFLIIKQKDTPDNRISIEIMSYSEDLVDLYQDIKQVFEEEHPNIRLDFVTLPETEYYNTLELLFESKQAPDIFYHSGGIPIFKALLDKGWIQPINFGGNLSVELEWKERWPNNSFFEGSNLYKNETYTFIFLDNAISGWGYMFFNKQVLRDAGLDAEQPPKTWNEFIDACRTIQAQTNSSGVVIPLNPLGDIRRIWTAIAGSIMTDKTFDYKNGRFCIDDPRHIAAFNFIQNLYNESLVWSDVIKGYEYDKTLARQAMATGLAAFHFDGSWIPGWLNTNGFNSSNLDLGISLPPFPDNWSRGALAKDAASTSFWVSNQTSHPEEVWTYIEWMTRSEGYFAQEFVKRGHGFLSYANNSLFIEDPIMYEMINISKSLKVTYPEPLIFNPELAKSNAFIWASNNVSILPEMTNVILNNYDNFTLIAQNLANISNTIFINTLALEYAAGLNVGISNYTFPYWNYDEDFIYP